MFQRFSHNMWGRWSWHIHSQEAERGERSCLAHFLLFIYSMPKQWCLPQWASLPTSVNLIRAIPHRHTQWFISQTILELKLTVEISYHIEYPNEGKPTFTFVMRPTSKYSYTQSLFIDTPQKGMMSF